MEIGEKERKKKSVLVQCLLLLWTLKMSRHKCNRADCPPINISGPKIKCCKCNSICYLKCYGFEAGEKIGEHETVKLAAQDGYVMHSFLSCMAFACCTDTLTAEEQKKALKMPASNRATSKARKTEFESISSELNVIKRMITSIHASTDKNTADIAEIKAMSTNTDANVKKVTELQQKKVVSRNISLSNASKTSFSHGQSTSFANVIQNETPKSAKRLRTNDIPITQKFEAPKPKMGTKSTVTRLNVVAKPTRIEKPVFKKAIWVSGFNPATTTEEIVEYIVTETPVNDKLKFNVHKLVKKDKDLSTMKYVSFKIEVNEEEFDILCNPELWPENVLVREFLLNKTLGDFFPSITQNNVSNSTERMDATDTPLIQTL